MYIEYDVECYTNENHTKFKYDVKGKAYYEATGSYTEEWVQERVSNVLRAGVALYGASFLDPENEELREKVFNFRNEGSQYSVSNVHLGVNSVEVSQYNEETEEYEETKYTKIVEKRINPNQEATM